MFKNTQSHIVLLAILSALVIVAQLSNAKTSPFVGITTIAGTDENFGGDGLPARDAIYQRTYLVKYLSSGEVYVSDFYKIRKISSNGKVSTIVGNGISGDSGEGGLAINARITNALSLDVNSAGEIVFSDDDNYKIKKISKHGIITTLAGTGNNESRRKVRAAMAPTNNYANQTSLNRIGGVAFHPTTGEVYFSEMYGNRIYKIDADGILVAIAGTGSKTYNGDGAALSINVGRPNQLLFNTAGDLFFSEEYSYRIRKLSNGQVTTIAGNGVYGYSGDGIAATSTPITTVKGLAFKPETGDLVFSDSGNSRIRLISAVSGNISTIVGSGVSGFEGDGGLASGAALNQLGGISYNPNGDLYIADTNNRRIRKVSAVDGTISTFSGGLFGDGYQANQYGVLKNPQGVTISSSGEVIIADTVNSLIRKVSNNGVISTIAGSFGAPFSEGVLATTTGLKQPISVVMRPNGDVYFADTASYRIRKISAADGKISTIVGNGISNEFTPDGNLANETVIGNVQAIAFNSQGELIFSESLNHRIRKVLSNGTVVTVAGIGQYGVLGGSFSGDGGLAVDAGLSLPSGMVVTSSDDIIFVDVSNWRIRVVFSNGTINTIAGNGDIVYSADGQLATDSSIITRGGIAMNSMKELIFTENNRIRKMFTNGTLTTIAGSQDTGFSGDGQLALNAQFSFPQGLAVDSNDNIYVADMFNYRIRKISTICPSSYVLSGSECIPTCFGLNSSNSQVCSGRGQCNDVDTCSCSTPYYGSNCELFDCNGIAKNSSQVCSGLGVCQSPNSCACQIGYSGLNCESFNCSGISKNSPQVCSSHGTCQSPNNCSCQTGYFGANCESFGCNGVEKNSSQVCSSHGICQSPNSCACQLGYTGLNCELFNCSGISKNSSQVCSSHGTCQSLNNCTCQSGYYGTNCESFNCTGIKSTASNVCSSRGQCTAPNTCKCTGNAFGSNCEFTVSSSLKINATASQITAISQAKLNDGVQTGFTMLLLVACLLFNLLLQ